MEKFDPEIRTLLKASGLSEAQIRNKEVKLTQYVKNRQLNNGPAGKIDANLQAKFDSSPLTKMGSSQDH